MQAAERAKSGRNLDPGMAEFNTVLRGIAQVSKADLEIMLAAEKARTAHVPKRGPKPRSSASGRAAGAREQAGTD